MRLTLGAARMLMIQDVPVYETWCLTIASDLDQWYNVPRTWGPERFAATANLRSSVNNCHKHWLALSWLVWRDMALLHLHCAGQMSIKTQKNTHKHTHTHLQTHTQNPGNHHSASQWAARGTRRAERSVFMCVCVYPVVNRDWGHMPCHRLSPLSLLPPLL